MSWLWSTVNTRRGYLGQVSTKQPFSVIRYHLYTHSSSVYSGKATWRVDTLLRHPCNYLERLLYKPKSHFYFLRDDSWLSYSVPSLVLYLVLVDYSFLLLAGCVFPLFSPLGQSWAMYFFHYPSLTQVDSFNKIFILKIFKEEAVALDTKRRQCGNFWKGRLSISPSHPQNSDYQLHLLIQLALIPWLFLNDGM